MRPGRLDRILYVGPPDLQGRAEILRIRTKGMSVAANLDIQEIAKLVSSCQQLDYCLTDCFRLMDVRVLR